jgi:hypothetical protein
MISLVGQWAVETEKALLKRFENPYDHILVALHLYGDGVCSGWGLGAAFENASFSLGNFPPDLMRSLLGKMNIGFTSSVCSKKLNHAMLFKHLYEKLGTKAKAAAEVKLLYVLYVYLMFII